MSSASALTIQVSSTIFTMPGKVPAAGGTALIDIASHALTHTTHQRSTTRFGLIGALHATEVWRNLFSKIFGYQAALASVGFSPVKGNSESGTAGTAIQAGRRGVHGIALLILLGFKIFTGSHPSRTRGLENGYKVYFSTGLVSGSRNYLARHSRRYQSPKKHRYKVVSILLFHLT
jgi:hypothetical protein